VFNLSGSEVLFILVIGLVVLGPEKLPQMLRRAGRLYGELRRLSQGVQTELKSALDEPTRELRNTTFLAKKLFAGDVDEPTGQPASSATDPEPRFVPYPGPHATAPGTAGDGPPRPADDSGAVVESEPSVPLGDDIDRKLPHRD